MNCWKGMTDRQAKVTRARTSRRILLTSSTCGIRVSAFHSATAVQLATRRDHLGCGPGVLRVLSLTTLCAKWQTVRTSCQLPLGSHYTVASQVGFWRSHRGKGELKQSGGPVPTFFLACAGSPENLQRTLPKQRLFLCMCPNSQPTHARTLTWRRRSCRRWEIQKMLF